MDIRSRPTGIYIHEIPLPPGRCHLTIADTLPLITKHRKFHKLPQQTPQQHPLTIAPLQPTTAAKQMFQVQQPVMENKHTLPPLSHIITAAALPFSAQAETPQQQTYQPQPQSHPSVAPRAEANDSLYKLVTPPSSTHSSIEKKDPPSPKYSARQPTDRCTCKHDGNHIPRPRNAFILFRQQHHQSVLDEGNVIKTNPDVSRELGKRWRDLSPNEKDYWNKLAEEEKKRHAEKYPGYRYIPRRFGNKKGSCPFCRAKATIREQTRTLQAQKTAMYPEETQKADVMRTYTPTLSEEHAVAQSFLSLRNQPQPQFMNVPQQPPQQQQPPMYYQQYPAMYPPHAHTVGMQSSHHHMQHQQQHHAQHPQQHNQYTINHSPLPAMMSYSQSETKSEELPRMQLAQNTLATPFASESPSENSKASCSIANFLN